MNRPYFSLFANFFLTLVISRPNFRGLAQYTLDALKQARTAGRLSALSAPFDALIVALTTAIAEFDGTLTERLDPTAGNTEAFRLARAAWLSFVQEQQIKVVNPALFGKAVLKDFRRYTRGKLAAYGQQSLLTHSEELVQLYTDNAAALQPFYATHNPPVAGQPAPPPLVTRAAALAQALRAADSARNSADAALDTSITTLKSDWVTLARCLRRAKGLLEATFDSDEEVYGFFDFSKANVTKNQKKADKQAVTPPTQ